MSKVFFFFFFLAALNMLFSHLDLRRFLARTSGISNFQDLELFKRLARRQMYQALLAILFLGGAGITGVYCLIHGELSLLQVIIYNGAIIVLSKLSKGLEEQSRSLKVDEKLEERYRNIGETWIKKPFPDF